MPVVPQLCGDAGVFFLSCRPIIGPTPLKLPACAAISNIIALPVICDRHTTPIRRSYNISPQKPKVKYFCTKFSRFFCAKRRKTRPFRHLVPKAAFCTRYGVSVEKIVDPDILRSAFLHPQKGARFTATSYTLFNNICVRTRKGGNEERADMESAPTERSRRWRRNRQAYSLHNGDFTKTHITGSSKQKDTAEQGHIRRSASPRRRVFLV